MSTSRELAIIDFVTKNIDDQKALAQYFSILTVPLPASVLLLKFPVDGTYENLLCYAGIKGTAYFKYLVELATPAALQLAISESNSSLLRMLANAGKYNLEAPFLQLLEKISSNTIDEAVFNEDKPNNNYFFIETNGISELILKSLLAKISSPVLHRIVAATRFNGFNLLFGVIAEATSLTPALLQILLEHLDDKTKENLLFTPSNGLIFFEMLFYRKFNNKEAYIASIFRGLGDKIRNAIVRKKYYSDINFFIYLIGLHENKILTVSTVHEILASIDQTVLDTLSLTHVNGMTMIFLLLNWFSEKNFMGLRDIDIANDSPRIELIKCILNYLSPKVIISFIANPPDYWKMYKYSLIDPAYIEELEHDAHLGCLARRSPTLLNQILRIALLENYPLNLSSEILHLLNTENLRLYFMQHPELDLQNQEGPKGLTNLFYASSFQKRIKKADKDFLVDVNFFLNLYNYLIKLMPEVVVLIVIDYIEKTTPVAGRFLYETGKEKSHHKTSEMKTTYHILKDFFPHADELIFKQDEASIISGYLADSFYLDNITASRLKKEKMALTESKAFFNKTQTITSATLSSHIKKVAAAKLALHKFIAPKIKKYGVTNLLELKKHYEDKTHVAKLNKLDLLEKNVRVSEKEYLKVSIKFLLESWDKKFVKKPTAAQKLQTETRAYGFECKDMQHDGNCFFHAVIDQLARRELECLGRNIQELRIAAICYMLDHLDKYKDFLDEHDGSLAEFVNKNLDSSNWADHLIISALANALSVNIVIIRSDGAAPNVVLQKNPVATLFIGHEVGQHYQSLVYNKDLVRTKTLDDYLIYENSLTNFKR
jgi:hypothetical protein